MNSAERSTLDLNNQIVVSIQKEIELYRGLVAMASLERKAICDEDMDTLAKISAEKQKIIASIDEVEVLFSTLRREWKQWTGKDREMVRPWIDLLTNLMRELANYQKENQQMLQSLLEEVRRGIDNEKLSGKAFHYYASQGKFPPRFVDIQR